MLHQRHYVSLSLRLSLMHSTVMKVENEMATPACDAMTQVEGGA